MTDTTLPLARFLDFTAMLRRAGFAVAPEQTMAWLAAIELLGPEKIGDIRRAARATLGRRRSASPNSMPCSMHIFWKR